MVDSQRYSRRGALQRGLAAAAGMAVPYVIPSGVLAAEGKPGANEQVIIGFVGTGGRSRLLMDQVPEGGRIVAIADCYRQRLTDTLKEKKKDWRTYQDYRKMFDSEKLNAVVVGTPDHIRTLPCIHACQAGLDVYAEKPLTVYIAEGRALVNAVRKHKRVFQVGSQQRTMAMNRIACEFIRDGGLGKLRVVQGVNYPGPRKYTGLPEEPVPDGDNWDAWCGPTELRPFNRNLQFGWMQWWDYSGGEMTNWGAHGIDQVQWALGESESGPVEIWPVSEGPSGKVSMRYKSGVVVRYELSGGPAGGAIFVGENGKIEINRNKFTSNPKSIAVELLKKLDEAQEEKKWSDQTALWQARWHIQNWLDCIKTRQKPNADVEIGHRSISVCHLANIAREAGRRLRWDPEKEQFIGDDEANRFVSRPRRKGYELPET